MKTFLVHVEGYEQSKYITCNKIKIDEVDNTVIYADHVRIEMDYKVIKIVECD